MSNNNPSLGFLIISPEQNSLLKKKDITDTEFEWKETMIEGTLNTSIRLL